MGEYAYQQLPVDFSMSYFINQDGDVIFSLRSLKGTGFNVGEVAVELGGGGHQPAAGFKMSIGAGLKASDGSYYKRVQVGIKLMEGEAITEGKKSYKVSEVGLIAILNYKDFNVQADTLKNEYALVSLEDSNNKIWAINGYVNVPFTFKTKEQLNMNDFHLYAVEAKEDTLVTKLQQTKGADDAYQTGSALISFHMPFNDMEFRDIFDQVVPKSDTIVVKVTAKGENDKELVSTVKCSASNMQGSY
jgi:c-di-AMP phosphodiesterase-like protein